MNTQNNPTTAQRSLVPLRRLSAFEAMGQAIKARMALSPSAIALNDLDAGRQYSYAAIERNIDALCAQFARSGLQRGDSIATNLENGADLIFLILGSLVYGARLALIEPQTPTARLSHFLNLTRSRQAFFSATIRDRNALLDTVQAGELPWLEQKGKEASAASYVPTTALDDDAIVIFSSGTTGDPKGIIHTHGNIVAELDAMIIAYDFKELMQHYLVLPLAHASGLYRSLVMPFFTGGTIHLRRQFEPQTFWADIVQNQVEFVQLVPSHIAVLNRSQQVPEVRPSALRFVSTASGNLPAKEQQTFEAKFGVSVLQGYGMTECTCGMVLNSLDGAIRRPGVAGLPLAVNEIQIVDSAGLEVERGEVGEIYVRGKNVVTRFLGYGGSSFDRGWMQTGDMGRIEPDGNLVIVGRRANIINRGAYKIYALEVEEALAALPGVTDAAVIGVPHPVLGQDIIAFVTSEQTLDSVLLLGLLREKISPFKIPTRIIPIEKLPRNKMGKVVLDDLQKLYLNRHGAGGVVDEVTIMARLRQLIVKIFGVDADKIKPTTIREDVSQWDSFGHLQVLLAIEHEFGIKISDEAAIAARSVSDLANLISHALRSEAGDA